MRALLPSLGTWLLGFVLLCQHVHAASKTGHAAECVFAYMAYRLDGLTLGQRAYNDKEYQIAKECANTPQRRCNFNEFLTYITRGSSSGQPAATASGDLDVRDYLQVENTIKGLAQSSDKGIETMVQSEHWVAKILAGADGSFNKLFSKSYPTFLLAAHQRIQAMPGGTPKDDATRVFDNAQKLLQNIAKLRQGEQDDAMWAEMRAEFNDNPQNRHYIYYHKDGNVVDLTARRPTPLPPMVWAEKIQSERSLFGITWHAINVTKTKEQNQMTYSELRPALLGFKQEVEHTWVITWAPTLKFPGMVGSVGLKANLNNVITALSMIKGGIGVCAPL